MRLGVSVGNDEGEGEDKRNAVPAHPTMGRIGGAIECNVIFYNCLLHLRDRGGANFLKRLEK